MDSISLNLWKMITNLETREQNEYYLLIQRIIKLETSNKK